MSASFAYGSPVGTVRDLRQAWRVATVATVVLFCVVASLIVNGTLSAGRAILIGIAAFAAAWAATVLADAAAGSTRAQGKALLVGTLAASVALFAASASATSDNPSRTLLAAISVLMSVLIWFHSVMTARRNAAFEASAGSLALLASAVGLIMLPTGFDAHIDSDAAGLLISTLAPLTGALLISRHSRRALVIAALIAVVSGMLIQQPADATVWAIVGALMILVLIADSSAPPHHDRAATTFTSVDAFLLTISGGFLAIYLAFSMDHPVRGLMMGSLAIVVTAASLIQRLIITERDERMAELARLAAEIRERARLDPLTELPNRAALDARLDEEVERAVRYRHPLSVCFIDIDHFKSINDTMGHQTGDQILREVASVIRATIRTPDFVARYGGEEFVVIAPGTWTEDASVLATRMQVAIADKVSQPLGGPITISIGIAGVPEHGRDAATILKVADLALYAAKYAGRNRVEIGFIDGPLVSP